MEFDESVTFLMEPLFATDCYREEKLQYTVLQPLQREVVLLRSLLTQHHHSLFKNALQPETSLFWNIHPPPFQLHIVFSTAIVFRWRSNCVKSAKVSRVAIELSDITIALVISDLSFLAGIPAIDSMGHRILQRSGFGQTD